MDKNVKLLTKADVLSEVEIAARKEVLSGQYVSSISLELKTMLYMAESYIIPYLVKEISNYKEIKADSTFAAKRFEKLVSILDSLSVKLDDLRAKYAEITTISDKLEEGLKLHETIVPLLSAIKDEINSYEKIASKEVYKLPTYPEMLY